MRLAIAIERFLESQKGGVSAVTLYGHRLYLGRFLKHFGNRELNRITRDSCKKFSRKWHPLASIKRLMNWAVKDAEILPRNPLVGMKMPARRKRNRILARAEKVRLLRGSDPTFRKLLIGLMESIARPRELREAKWGQIRTSGSPGFMKRDLVDGMAFFWINEFKGQDNRSDKFSSRVIPISRRFGRLLARMWGRRKPLDSLIFTNRSGKMWTPNAIICRFRRLRGNGDFSPDVNGESVVAYSLRHTAATEAVGAGLSSLTLAELMGHSDIRMTRRYIHLCPDHLVEAMHSLEAFRRGVGRKKKRPGSRRPRSQAPKGHVTHPF